MPRAKKGQNLESLFNRPIAHRGLHGLKAGAVENSKTAFKAAIAAGYAIECDVQLTSGNDAVVFHDETLDRVMAASGLVRDRTAAQLAALRYRSGPDQIMTLRQLLHLVKGAVPLFIEIKSHWDGNTALCNRVLADLETYAGPCAIMSFDPGIIAHAARCAPNRIRGLVADRVHDPYYGRMSIGRRRSLRQFVHLASSRPQFISYDWTGLPFPPVQQARAAGLPVISWTIRSDMEASRARRYSDQITFEGFLPGCP